MFFSRPGAAFACLRAALLFVVLTAAAPVLSRADQGDSPGTSGGPFPLLAAGGQGAEEDIFGGPGASGKKILFTIFFDADTGGELHPCPT